MSYSDHSSAGSHRLTLAAICFCICAFNFVLLWAQRDKLAFGWADFRAAYSESILYRENPGAKMYDYQLQAEIQNQMFPEVSTPGIALAYDHPPYELGIFLPFSYLSYAGAYYAWITLTFVLALIAGILVTRNLRELSEYWKPFAVALIITLYPFLMLVRQGQDTALALICLVGAWLCLRRESFTAAGICLGIGLFKFQVFIPLAILLAFWRPKLLKGFVGSGAIVTILSMAMVGRSGVMSYISLLTRMAGNSTSAASEAYAMDARSMPNLRGLVYGIASGASGAVPDWLAWFVPVFIGVTSLAIFVWAGFALLQVRGNSGSAADLVFAGALCVALVVSFHLQMHDLTLLALAFALVLNWMMGSGRNVRAGYVACMASFYVLPLALVLTKYRVLCFYGAVLMAISWMNMKYLERESSE